MLAQSAMTVVFVSDETISQSIEASMTADQYPKALAMDGDLKVPQ